MLFAKSSDGFGAEHCRLHRVTVNIRSSAGSNVTNFGSLGSVGIYNTGAEFFTLDGAIIKADTPLVYTGTNICDATSPGSPEKMYPETMSQVHMFDTEMDNMPGCGINNGSCCMIMELAHQFNVSAYFSNYSKRSGYAVMTMNHCWNNQVFANVEDYSADNDFGVLAKLDSNSFTANDLFFNCPGSNKNPLININGDATNITVKCSTYTGSDGQKLFNSDCTLRNSVIYTSRYQNCGTKNLVDSIIVGRKTVYALTCPVGTIDYGNCVFGAVGNLIAQLKTSAEQNSYTIMLVADGLAMAGIAYCEMIGLDGTVIPCTLSNDGVRCEKPVPAGTYRISATFTL